MRVDSWVSHAKLNSFATSRLLGRLNSVEVKHQRIYEAVSECEVSVNYQVLVVFVHAVQQLAEYSHHLLFRWRRPGHSHVEIRLQRADGAEFLHYY